MNSSSLKSNLVLGTFQLGQKYGISNIIGKPDINNSIEIVKTAWESGIRYYDTAQIYGNSEEVLGKCFRKLNLTNDVFVITKLSPQLDHLSMRGLIKSVEESLKMLKVEKLYCLMIHDENCLKLINKGLDDTLNEIVSRGYADNIGISVYSPEKALESLNVEIIKMVQIPGNILDRRFEKANIFELSKKLNKILFVRSVFLQGLMLLDVNSVPKRMDYAKSTVNKIKNISVSLGITPKELAITYVKYKYCDAKILFGIEDKSQILENIEIYNNAINNNIVQIVETEFDNVNLNILNPSLWPK